MNYNLFLFTRDVLQKILIYSPNINYELRNILERWLLTINNEKVIKNKIIYSKKSIEKFKQELQEKYIEEKALEKIIFMVNQFNNQPEIDYDYKLIFGENSVNYGEFDYGINADRLKILRKFGDQNVAEMLMRYKSIISKSQHWNIPTKIYENLVKLYDINVEGFASPLNSQLLKILEKPKFCSLFPEVDGPFGSIGDFFNADLSGYNIVANPPFIESLMNDMVDKIEKTFKSKKETLFVVCVPFWNDAEFYKKLEKSKYLAKNYIFKNKEFYFEFEEKKIDVGFNTSIFLLANSKRELVDPNQIIFTD